MVYPHEEGCILSIKSWKKLKVEIKNRKKMKLCNHFCFDAVFIFNAGYSGQ